MNQEEKREVSFKRKGGMNASRIEDKKLRSIASDMENGSYTKEGDLYQVLEGLNYNKKNITNLNMLVEMKNITVEFIKSADEDLVRCINNDRDKFKDAYFKSIRLKNSKIIGSFKNKMYLNTNLNIDVCIEYELDTKLGRKCKYRNLHLYHNMYVHMLKNIFYENNFLSLVKKSTILHNVDISIGINTWTNRCKSILILNLYKKKNHVGSIHVLLCPTKKVASSLSRVYTQFYAKWEELICTGGENDYREEAGKGKRNGMGQHENGEKVRKKIKYMCMKRTLLKQFILTECNIIECDNLIRKAINSFQGYRKAVKLLKLWCINKKLLFTFSTYNEDCSKAVLKNHEEFKFTHFAYHGDVNSFLLGLLCSFVCFTRKLEHNDYVHIFTETVKFLSFINLQENFFEYHEGVYSVSTQVSKGDKVGTYTQPKIFLLNKTYDIFRDRSYFFLELIEEAKKAMYDLKCGNFFQLFAKHIDCFPLNYEEEIFFPLLVSNNMSNYNEEIGNLKRCFIRGLADRVEEITFRLISFHQYERGTSSGGKSGGIRANGESSGQALSIFEDIFFDKKTRGECNYDIRTKRVLFGVSFFLKTNGTIRWMDKASVLYNPEKVSAFKRFWGDKAEVRRFENNTIFDVVMWKKPGKTIRKKKRQARSAQGGSSGKGGSSGNSGNSCRGETSAQGEKRTRNTGNFVLDAMFSELNEKKTKSVHVQIVKHILKKKNFKESINLMKTLHDKERYIRTNDNILFCAKKVKNKSFYVYFSNPLLVKDIQFCYYEKIHDQYNEIKNILYSIKENLFSISNVNSSNDIIKMADIGYKQNCIKMVDIMVDIKYNNDNSHNYVNVYKNGNNFFKIYEITKDIIKNYFIKNGKNIIKIENKNFCIDIYFKLTIFRLNIFNSKIFEKNLIQITNLDNINIMNVKNIMNVHNFENIKNFIYKPIISSFISFYSFKFYSFNISLKICKLWLCCKGIPFNDDFVENILFFLYTLEFKTHIDKCNYFLQNKILIQNDSLLEFLLHYRLLRMINFARQKEDKLYQNYVKKRLVQKNGRINIGVEAANPCLDFGTSSGVEAANPCLDFGTSSGVEADIGLETGSHTGGEAEVWAEVDITKREGQYGNTQKTVAGASAGAGAGAGAGKKRLQRGSVPSMKGKRGGTPSVSSPTARAKRPTVEYEEDQFLDSFSFSSKNILVTFLTFLVSYDWDRKPLIIDYDGCLTEEHKMKLINSFVVGRRNKEEKKKKKFWICSIYDPHCELISLPHNLFDFILNMAKKDLQLIKELHTNFEREKWLTLFLMEKCHYDVILNFHSADKSIDLFKKKIKISQATDDKRIDSSSNGENFPNTRENLDEFSMVGNDYDINRSTIKSTSSDMLRSLHKHELIHVYKTHFLAFLLNLENKFQSQITIMYNPLCFSEIANIHMFRKMIKHILRKASTASEYIAHVHKSWTPNVFITFNPAFVSTISLQNEPTGVHTPKEGESSSLSLNNFNAFLFYIKNNAKDMLKGVHFPTL
ncbi:conserved Plasmodium protein, unknown function [Plasmodium ovale]|uniref:Uncharacterized protein n=1 Tax=Plasmodium ovale TaxID=36330 RepID=A0A1D3TMK1_PLAOA|nr:conserved Plasmodium protein, unknown function [Plasmodium ovale]